MSSWRKNFIVDLFLYVGFVLLLGTGLILHYILPHGITEIHILGPGCMQCDELMRRVMSVVTELGLAADVQHIRDLKEIAGDGPLPTPALVVNGKVKAAGKILRVEKIKKLVEQENPGDSKQSV